MEAPVVVALVAAMASLLVAIWNWFAARTNQRELERMKLDSSIQLVEVKSQIQSRKTLEDARLDYQFEARKRLYNHVEPLSRARTLTRKRHTQGPLPGHRSDHAHRHRDALQEIQTLKGCLTHLRFGQFTILRSTPGRFWDQSERSSQVPTWFSTRAGSPEF
jgi:hypothetical protein